MIDDFEQNPNAYTLDDENDLMVQIDDRNAKSMIQNDESLSDMAGGLANNHQLKGIQDESEQQI